MFYPYTAKLNNILAELNKILTNEIYKYLCSQSFKEIKLNLIEYKSIDQVIPLPKEFLEREYEQLKIQAKNSLTQKAYESQDLEDEEEERRDQNQAIADKELASQYKRDLVSIEIDLSQKRDELSRIKNRLFWSDVNQGLIIMSDRPSNRYNSLRGVELNRVYRDKSNYKYEERVVQAQIDELTKKKDYCNNWIIFDQKQNSLAREQRYAEREKRQLASQLSPQNAIRLTKTINREKTKLDNSYQEQFSILTRKSYLTYILQILNNLEKLSLSPQEKNVLKDICIYMEPYHEVMEKIKTNSLELEQNMKQRADLCNEFDINKQEINRLQLNNQGLYVQINRLMEEENKFQYSWLNYLRFLCGGTFVGSLLTAIINPNLIMEARYSFNGPKVDPQFAMVAAGSLFFTGVTHYYEKERQGKLSINTKNIEELRKEIEINNVNMCNLEKQQEDLMGRQNHLEKTIKSNQEELIGNKTKANDLLEKARKISLGENSSLLQQSIFSHQEKLNVTPDYTATPSYSS